MTLFGRGQIQMRQQIVGLIGLSLGLPGFALQMSAHFNHDTSVSFQEPYRNINRNGEDFEALLLSEISSAKKRVWIAVQEIRLPRIAKKLVELKDRGIDVRIVLEDDYNFTLENLTGQEIENGEGYSNNRLKDYFAFVDLNQNGKLEPAEIAARDAVFILKSGRVPMIDDTADGSKGSGFMHHKFVIVDSTKVIVTSSNFTMSDTFGDVLESGSRGNANALMRFSSVEMNRVFEEEFSYLWSGRFKGRKPVRAPVVIRGPKSQVTVQFSGFRSAVPFEQTTGGLIVRNLLLAKSQVSTALFVFTLQEAVNALEERNVRGGVRVGALVDPNFAYRDYSKLFDMWGTVVRDENCKVIGAARPWAQPVREAGAPRLAEGDMLHHKFAVIDESKVVFGSFNWSRAGVYSNDETLLVVEQPQVAAKFQSEYDRLLENADLGMPQRIRRKIDATERNCR